MNGNRKSSDKYRPQKKASAEKYRISTLAIDIR